MNQQVNEFQQIATIEQMHQNAHLAQIDKFKTY
jgi:hypothetical protein